MGTWPTWAESRRRRIQAVALRRQGLSYKQIRALIGGSIASLSIWLRDIPLTEAQREALRFRQRAGARNAPRKARERRLAREAEIRLSTAADIGQLTERELFIAGVVAYAAEGKKKKAWQSSVMTQFTNSDPRMILLFLRWLELVGVDQSSLSFRIAIHEDADVEGALRYWSEITRAAVEGFMRTTLKKGNPMTRRRNVGPAYRGCLVVTVRRSGDLNKQLEGWFDAIASRASTLSTSSVGPIRAAIGAPRA